MALLAMKFLHLLETETTIVMKSISPSYLSWQRMVRPPKSEIIA